MPRLTTWKPNKTNDYYFLDKSIGTIIAILGILKAGLGYIILDMSYPDHYLKSIISTSQTRLFIGIKSSKQRLLDILSNIMLCCTNDAKFWGGSRFWLGRRPTKYLKNLKFLSFLLLLNVCENLIHKSV